MKKVLLIVAAASFSSPLPAQTPAAGEPADSTHFRELAEVTVTTSRKEEKILDAGKSITVFTGADFQHLPYQNVADLLGRAAGVYTTGTFQNPGALQYLYLRGADARQTLVMVDGVKLSDASTPDNGLDLSEISLNNVERIEIVRGAQGTLYGASATGGVINIITQKNRKNGISGHAGETAGTFGQGTSALNSTAGLSYSSRGVFYIRGDLFNSTNRGLNAH
jgi:vitamin B12 transporter